MSELATLRGSSNSLTSYRPACSTPRSASKLDRIASASRTCSTRLILGRMIPWSPRQTAASRSRIQQSQIAADEDLRATLPRAFDALTHIRPRRCLALVVHQVFEVEHHHVRAE